MRHQRTFGTGSPWRDGARNTRVVNSARVGRAGVRCRTVAVKILGDPMASQVKFAPHPSSVRGLRRLRVPPSLPQRARNRPVETSTYRVHARLVESRFEDDSDFHLVIADPRTGGTMIVEFPASYCTRPRRRRCAGGCSRPGRRSSAPAAPPHTADSTAPRHRDDHRCWLLRLLARPDRCRAERDRVAPRARILGVVPKGRRRCLSAATPSAGWRAVRGVVPRRVHPSAAPRPRLQGHPLPQLQGVVERARPRPAPLRRQPRRRRLRELKAADRARREAVRQRKRDPSLSASSTTPTTQLELGTERHLARPSSNLPRRDRHG
jgi:hypothetical protein